MQAATSLITILFTDIEGSTRLWEQEGAQMSMALTRHDAVARGAVEGNHGIIVKTTGDGIYAAFDDPLDALLATLTLQRSLIDPATTNGIPIRVRCGLHLGEVERRDNDYHGNAVNRTARIMSAAHGGQILVSQAMVDRVAERLPPAVALRDLGIVRLKDLSSPEHVYQVLHPALRQDFPALRSLEATPNNLPQQLTSFIGRERELEEATTLLKTTRLLTLLGMGGLGKTRLSMQIAAEVIDGFPDGVWFVDLAPVVDPAFVPATAAQVLNVREEPGKPLTQTLCAHLKSHKALLILDNCEHLVAACADLANALLRGAPEIRVIATTREALRVPGEQTYPVRPMVVPERTADVETLARTDFVQLFLERARLQKPGFTLTEGEAPAVAELCARLEGIPLALELAAARLRALSVREINARLKDRFKLLTSGGRVLLQRQQTLHALVAWSYDLLQENERLVFDRLSVFAGSFPLSGAEEVCGAEPLAPEDVLDLVSSLVDKSLVMAEEQAGSTRYRLLETLREFGKARLTEHNEFGVTAARHCNHFLTLAKTARRGLQGPEQAEWIRRLEIDLDDLRVAIALALSGGVDPILAVKFEVALMSFRILRGYVTEGRNFVRAALALPAVQASDVAHAHALYVGAGLADDQGDNAEAVQMLEACLDLRRKLGQPVETAATLSTLSLVRLHAGDATKAREGEEEAVTIFRQQEDRIGEAIGLLHLGEICAYIADDAAARDNFERCLAIAKDIESREIEAECERWLGESALEAGDVAAARARFVRSLEVCREAEDKRNEATVLWWMGKTALAAGDWELARIRLSDALRAFQTFEMKSELLDCLEDHARLKLHEGATEGTVRLYAATAAYHDRLALSRPPRHKLRWHNAIEAARAAIGEAAFESAWQDGQSWTLEKAIGYALAPSQAAIVTA